MIAAAIPEERAKRDPLGPCISDERRDVDNLQFASMVMAVAAVFAAAGLSPGDVLAIMMPNWVELATSMFAAWRLGAAVTPVNPALTAQEARYQIDDAAAALIVADDASARKLRGIDRPIIPVHDVISPAVPEVAVPISATPDSLALLIYTGGTTGRPRGVMLDHANITRTADRIVAWFEMDRDTRCLLVQPLYHVNGIMVSVISPLLAGGSTFIAEGFDADRFWVTVERARPTFFSAVPAIYALLMSRPGTQPDTRNLRYAICGAAPMPHELIAEFEQRYGVPVVEGYGRSECTVCCTANPLHGIRKPGTVGLPLPGVDVGVVDAQDRLLPVGVVGEVVVRGPTVMRGYLGRPAETAQTLRGGWLHTGDVGLLDQDGYLMLADRVNDQIIHGRDGIHPREIEDVAST